MNFKNRRNITKHSNLTNSELVRVVEGQDAPTEYEKELAVRLEYYAQLAGSQAVELDKLNAELKALEYPEEA